MITEATYVVRKNISVQMNSNSADVSFKKLAMLCNNERNSKIKVMQLLSRQSLCKSRKQILHGE